jgi:SPP1 gp7 family putative phage head morphogenesis protein
MKTLKTQPLTEADWDGMEEQLNKLFFDIIFKPILDLLLPHNAQIKAAAREIKNAKEAIVAALRSGKLQYSNGVFSGEFNALLTRELKKIGAVWNKTTKNFRLEPNRLPPDVAAMAQEYNETAEALHRELDKRLAEIESNLKGIVASRPVDATETVSRVQAGFERSAGKEADAFSDLTEEGKAKLAELYSRNLEPYIEKFSSETILDLRKMVADNAQHGYRFDKLVDRIQNRYDVSKSKAKFLARNETAMLVAKHRQVRFGDVGITRYIWRTSGKPSVRDDHKKLNGREFLYSDPPVVDQATGRKANPGEDYNCQCRDEPILPEVGVMA